MAHLLPTFPSNKGTKYGDQQNEKNEQLSFYFPENQIMNSAIPPPPPPQNDGLLNNPVHHRSDQNTVSLKSHSFNDKKCHVYVHHFNKIPSKSSSNYMQNNWRSGSEIHQNMYKHEFSDFYNTKMHTLRKQFDNLSLQSKKHQSNASHKIPKSHNTQYKYPTSEGIDQSTKIPYVKSNSNAKINKSILFKREHKAAIDKLEESYWAKWKPNKIPPNKTSHPKMKGMYTEKELYPNMKSLYTENEKIKTPYQTISRSGRRRERGDSNEAIMPSEKHEIPNDNLIYVENPEPNEIQQKKHKDVKETENEENCQDKQDENQNEAIVLTRTSVIMTHESDSECNVGLKHTDSFILTIKKQGQEKPRYQQPKCIKLFKNAGYTTSTPTNFVKSGTRGGSYPLKSCLKKENAKKPSLLGRPGSPIRTTSSRRPGKANRFTK